MSVPARNLTLRSHLGADRHPTLSLGTLYVAAFQGDPAGTGVEPDTTGGYARVALANNATLWGTLDGSAVQAASAVDVTFPTATGVWSLTTVDHWAVFDNATGGTLWYLGALSANIAPTGVGDVPRIPAGQWSIVVDA